MNLEEAEARILAEWGIWRHRELGSDKKASGTDGFAFYLSLDKGKSELLDFPAESDKWQIVHAWLLKVGVVSD
ncbi:MAG: hypothetical protein R3229_15070 [Alphaproteobacteria bacterium]|nr:hypothetical protein [Alphaproteobacteria bacterium]